MSLDTLYPQLAKEWYQEMNVLTPKEILPLSNRKVWWKCREGHLWNTTVYSRSIGNGCPFCSRKRKSKITMDYYDKMNPETEEVLE